MSPDSWPKASSAPIFTDADRELIDRHADTRPEVIGKLRGSPVEIARAAVVGLRELAGPHDEGVVAAVLGSIAMATASCRGDVPSRAVCVARLAAIIADPASLPADVVAAIGVLARLEGYEAPVHQIVGRAGEFDADH